MDQTRFSEKDLIQLRAGDRVALKKAWDIHADFVFFIARKFFRRSPAVDDAVQEVFLKLAQKGKTLKDASALKSWLATTTRNTCIDMIRRESKTLLMEGDQMEQLANDQMPLHEADFLTGGNGVELQMVGQWMDDIANEPGGETVAMHYREGLTVATIAARRGESVGTVTSRLTRLRQKLGSLIRAQKETHDE